MPILQFAPFSSIVSPAFWHKLTELKIDILKLSDASLPITGTYTAGRTLVDKETGKDVYISANFSVGGESFSDGATTGGEERQHQGGGGSTNVITARGTFKNFNTIEEFKALDKTKFFDEEAQKIWDSVVKTKSTAELNRFFVITFADLKKYKYYYWYSFPAFVSKPAWEIGDEGWQNAEQALSRSELVSINAQLHALPTLPAFFLVKRTNPPNSPPLISKVEDYDTFFADTPASDRIVSFTDPSADPTNPGWPLRNLLAYIHHHHSPSSPSSPSSPFTVNVLRWRDTEHSASPSPNAVWRSQLGVVSVAASASAMTSGGEGEGEGGQARRPGAVGWERNPHGKLGARVADLAPMMDPKRLAAQAVDLNLKLMRWRILPELDLDKVAGTRCLLLGAGTLGCYVARGLMGWGVRTITFVDSSTVSFSNPVRQPLFEFEDCLDGGKPKAEAAAEALKRVFPGINATGHTLSIPMPGHPLTPTTLPAARASVTKLEQLIASHDAVFLLMDSRESRWLPTVVGAAQGKVVVNAALGFDTYLVMRHGVRAGGEKGEGRLGCYYCNDVVAPGDSLTDRTLDQMCTVTRPGLAPIAAASAVELLVSVVQHPLGVHAPAPPPTASSDLGPSSSASYTESGGSVLGLVPHQIRGFLAQWRNLMLVGRGWEGCVGCGENVLRAYEKDRFEMLHKVFDDEKYLEELAGLDKLKAEGDAAVEAMEALLDEEDEEEWGADD